MAKWQNDTVLDQALSYLKTNVDHVYVNSTQPTTFAQASSSYLLGGASYTITGSPGDGSGSGRAITIQAANSIAITSSGNMQHISLTGSIASTDTLLYVTTIPASSQASVSASDKVNMGAWTIKLADAA